MEAAPIGGSFFSAFAEIMGKGKMDFWIWLALPAGFMIELLRNLKK
jgi:hypothetical protein